MTNDHSLKPPTRPDALPLSGNHRGLVLCLTLTLLSCSWLQQAQANESETSIEQQLLAARGFSISAESIRRIFGEATRDKLSPDDIARLIQTLGSEDYETREAATQRILQLPDPPTKLLEQAKAGDDLEISMRAARILELAQKQVPLEDSLTFACLLLIRSQKELRMTEDLLQHAKQWSHPSLRRASWLAMQQTVRAEDVPRLKAALEDEQEDTRAMALVGLLALSGKSDEQQSALETFKLAQQPKLVQFVLFKHRLEQGDLQNLPELAAFCFENDAALRALAIHALHSAFDSQKVSKVQLLEQFGKRSREPKIEQREEQGDLKEFAEAAWQALQDRIEGTGHTALSDWADYLSSKLVHGKSEGQPTAFASRIPGSLLSVMPIEKRTANTINSVASRHGTSPWLYPTRGRNEAPHVFFENGSWYFPIYGTWRQHWGGGWTTLDQDGQAIKSDSNGGPHLESEVDYFVVPTSEM